METFLDIINRIFSAIYIISGLLMIIFLFAYIFTENMKYGGLTWLCFILGVVFSKLESLTMKKLLDEF